jgi:hypothetical protein
MIHSGLYSPGKSGGRSGTPMKNISRSDVVLVMVHVWEDDPSLPEIKWTEHARRCALGANQAPWTKIWQFDFLNTAWYQQHVKDNNIPGWQEHLQITDNGMVPHRTVLCREQDWITTSNHQTKAVIEHLDPHIVLFGGLHKDLCVRGVLLDIKDHNREYVESDLLSYTWKDTLRKVEDYDPSFKR